MQTATIRIKDTLVLALHIRRLDARNGGRLLQLIADHIQHGVRKMVLDFAPETVFDFAGIESLARACVMIGGGKYLKLTGLGARARVTARTLGLSKDIEMLEWWADAVEDQVTASPQAEAA